MSTRDPDRSWHCLVGVILLLFGLVLGVEALMGVALGGGWGLLGFAVGHWLAGLIHSRHGTLHR